MEAAESVLLPPSECNVTWQFALCLILPTLKQENPAQWKLVTTDHATETSAKICRNEIVVVFLQH